MSNFNKMTQKELSKKITALRIDVAKKKVEVSAGKGNALGKLRLLKKELARALTAYPNAKKDK